MLFLELSTTMASNELDPDYPKHLLAREGDELTLYFQTSERVLNNYETIIHEKLKPEVVFEVGSNSAPGLSETIDKLLSTGFIVSIRAVSSCP